MLRCKFRPWFRASAIHQAIAAVPKARQNTAARLAGGREGLTDLPPLDVDDALGVLVDDAVRLVLLPAQWGQSEKGLHHEPGLDDALGDDLRAGQSGEGAHERSVSTKNKTKTNKRLHLHGWYKGCTWKALSVALMNSFRAAGSRSSPPWMPKAVSMTVSVTKVQMCGMKSKLSPAAWPRASLSAKVAARRAKMPEYFSSTAKWKAGVRMRRWRRQASPLMVMSPLEHVRRTFVPNIRETKILQMFVVIKQCLHGKSGPFDSRGTENQRRFSP